MNKLVNNQDDLIESIVLIFKEYLPDLMSDYELGLIRNGLFMIHTDIPTTRLALAERCDKLIKIKANFRYISDRIYEIRRPIIISFDREYNRLYSVLSKQNMPSKQAIESQMYFSHEEVYKDKTILDNLSKLIEMLDYYSNLIDKLIRNMENKAYSI